MQHPEKWWLAILGIPKKIAISPNSPIELNSVFVGEKRGRGRPPTNSPLLNCEQPSSAERRWWSDGDKIAQACCALVSSFLVGRGSGVEGPRGSGEGGGAKEGFLRWAGVRSRWESKRMFLLGCC